MFENAIQALERLMPGYRNAVRNTNIDVDKAEAALREARGRAVAAKTTLQDTERELAELQRLSETEKEETDA